MAVRIIVVFILSTMFLMGLDSKVSYTTDSEFYSLVLMALALAVLVVFICWWVSKKMESSTSTVWKITKGVITGVVVLFVVLFGVAVLDSITEGGTSVYLLLGVIGIILIIRAVK